MKIRGTLFLPVIAAVMLLPLASAQFYDYTYYSFSAIYESYAFNFLLFALFFWLVGYYSFKNIFGGKAVPAILAAIVSLLITQPVLQNFGEVILEQNVLKWIMIVAAIAAVFFLIGVIWSIFKKKFADFKLKWLCWLLFILWAFYLTRNIHQQFPSFLNVIPNNAWHIAGAVSLLYLLFTGPFSQESKKSKEERELRRNEAEMDKAKTDQARMAAEQNKLAIEQQRLDIQARKIAMEQAKKAKKDADKATKKAAEEAERARGKGIQIGKYYTGAEEE